MNAAAKGARNERRSAAILASAGYYCVRSAASKGVFDIIGISSQDVILCQVKTRDWPGHIEMATLREFVAPPTCRKIVHRWRPRMRLPDTKEIK